MRDERGASQILFGLLPMQTADFQARVWRVVEWVDPIPVGLDQESLRSGLLRAIEPWTMRGQDGGLADSLRRGHDVEVVKVNPDRGVLVESFPKLWRCKACNRLRDRSDRACACGASLWAQLHFVAYHTCGALSEPRINRCNAHNDVQILLPGSASTREIQFKCPQCNRILGRGLVNRPCACGNGMMSVTVHRAAVVYTPRIVVLVNPSSPAEAARIRAAGGGARALEWILEGMIEPDLSHRPQTVDTMIDLLVRQGISESTARRMAERARQDGEIADHPGVAALELDEPFRTDSHDEALNLASATSGGRLRVSDMIEATTPPLRTLYDGAYLRAVETSHLEAVEFIPAFPVATLAYGYTRGEVQPGQSRLVAFREQRGRLRVHAQLSNTEALLFRLDPRAVFDWLVRRGFPLGVRPATSRDARLAVLRRANIPTPAEEHPDPFGAAVLGLIHSYAHRAIRRIAAFAGIERDSLAEYLITRHLSFIVYAAARGEFVLGGLQAVFETQLHRFLEDLLGSESRCALDPGCRNGGGACMACLHLGEPSCRYYNRFLNRDHLFGDGGFLR